MMIKIQNQTRSTHLLTLDFYSLLMETLVRDINFHKIPSPNRFIGTRVVTLQNFNINVNFNGVMMDSFIMTSDERFQILNVLGDELSLVNSSLNLTSEITVFDANNLALGMLDTI
jgi:hypothetical protein